MQVLERHSTERGRREGEGGEGEGVAFLPFLLSSKQNSKLAGMCPHRDDSFHVPCSVAPTVQHYPETRHRYWSGYMLFYEAVTNHKPQGSPRYMPKGLFTRQDALLEGVRYVRFTVILQNEVYLIEALNERLGGNRGNAFFGHLDFQSAVTAQIDEFKAVFIARLPVR